MLEVQARHIPILTLFMIRCFNATPKQCNATHSLRVLKSSSIQGNFLIPHTMASSRWKRFAFFERNTLSLASEVLEDLIPIGGGASSANLNTAPGRSSMRRSMHSLNEAAEASANDSVSLVVTTASLPLNSKPAVVHNSNTPGNATAEDHSLALNDMWSSLTACNLPENSNSHQSISSTIKLPSQAQALQDESNVVSSTHSVDGLVLVFVTSRDTDRIHCFDVTVRCTPPVSSGKKDEENNKSNNPDNSKDLEDLDGWRGYIAPMQKKNKKSSAKGGSSAEDRIIAEHMGASSNENNSQKEGVIGIATTRASSGHRPVHMACITATNLVVCVDPHLYLSW